MKVWSGRVVACGLLVLSVACGPDLLGPSEPEVRSAVDSFQFQATALHNVSAVLDYAWRNSGTVASVNHATTTDSGTARLVITASDGGLVYDRALVPTLNERTAGGRTGSWTVRIVLSNYSGTLNLRVEKP